MELTRRKMHEEDSEEEEEEKSYTPQRSSRGMASCHLYYTVVCDSVCLSVYALISLSVLYARG